jgi:hypothetical protein
MQQAIEIKRLVHISFRTVFEKQGGFLESIIRNAIRKLAGNRRPEAMETAA